MVSIYAADGIDFTIDVKNDKPIFVIKDISYEDVGKAVFAYKSLIIKNHSVNSVYFVINRKSANPHAIEAGARFACHDDFIPFYVVSIRGGASNPMSAEESEAMANKDIPLRVMEVMGVSPKIVEKLKDK